jgi:putative hemolysin
MEIEIIVAVLLLLILGFIATVDAAFTRISDVGLRRISSEDDSTETSNSVKFVREILENRPRFRFALSSAIQVLLIAFAVLVTVIVGRFPFTRLEFLAVSLAIALVATVIFRQILPRLLARNNTEKKLLFLLPAIRPIYGITSFFAEAVVKDKQTKAREKIEMTLAPNLSDERDDEGTGTEDFQALMEVGEAEGIIEEEQREMIETFVEFSDTRAREIMTPRTDICALSATATIRDARDLIIEEKYSRIPVYRESIDDIVGVIYVRDLMQAWAHGREEDLVETIVREALFVPETKTAAGLLKDMQQNHIQVAVVIDEYGGVAGLITAEDILEEIVGEIEDEDTEEEEVIEIVAGGEGYYDVIGSTEIFKIERIFDADLEGEDYTTIAGLVTTEAGYVPKVGEKLQLQGLDIEVLQADEKKIHLLRLRRKQTTDLDPTADE